jgi:hypothetical protein
MALNVPPPGEDKILQALKIANDRGLLPTRLGSAGLRELAADVRARSVFLARGTNVHYLTKLKEVINQIASGGLDDAGARVVLKETLRALNYTPEGGFPDETPGSGVETRAPEVPPAVRGTLQDLSSNRRLELVVRTQRELVQGAAQQQAGQDPDRNRAAPAWELIRFESRRVPRDWVDRIKRIGGKTAGGRIIMLKGDPRWGELGGSGNFDDALDVDHPPFAFNSGMGWVEVPAREVRALDVRGPDGETLDEWLGGEPVQTIRGAVIMPEPKLSMADADKELLEAWAAETKATEGKSGSYDFKALLAAELKKAQDAYGEGGDS